VAFLYECGDGHLGSIKPKRFCYQLNNCQLLKEDPVLRRMSPDVQNGKRKHLERGSIENWGVPVKLMPTCMVTPERLPW
jgi:hypothetical protein